MYIYITPFNIYFFIKKITNIYMDILFPFENNELDLNLFISYLITNKDLFKNEYHDEYEIFNKIKSKLSII